MKTFIFHTSWGIEANDEEEARIKFADSSMDFAADAECDELTKCEVATCEKLHDVTFSQSTYCFAHSKE